MSHEISNVKGHWYKESGYKFCPYCGQALAESSILCAVYTGRIQEIKVVQCNNEKCSHGPTIIRDLKE